jgi:two-component system, OmpR family, response regulator
MTTASGRPLRILLVEDENHIGRIIELTLPELQIPYEFVSVLSAEEGLEAWLKQPFDMLLTDYNLRGMNGLKLVSQIKELGSKAPMMLITAYDSQEVRREARSLVDEYIVKPFFMDDLLDAIRRHLPTTTREVNG